MILNPCLTVTVVQNGMSVRACFKNRSNINRHVMNEWINESSSNTNKKTRNTAKNFWRSPLMWPTDRENRHDGQSIYCASASRGKNRPKHCTRHLQHILNGRSPLGWIRHIHAKPRTLRKKHRSTRKKIITTFNTLWYTVLLARYIHVHAELYSLKHRWHGRSAST